MVKFRIPDGVVILLDRIEAYILRQQLKAGAARWRLHIEEIEGGIPQVTGIVEAHIHISVAGLIARIVVTAPLEPDKAGRAIFRSFLKLPCVRRFRPFLLSQAWPTGNSERP